MTQTRRSAAEIIAFHFCADIADIRDSRYHPTRFASPAIFTVGDNYYCAPSGSQKPPQDREFSEPRWDWKPIGTYYGRTVYEAKSE